MKKILLIMLALMLALAPGASAGRYEQDGDFLYELREDGTARMTRYLGQESTVVIPAQMGGVPVTEIRSVDAQFPVDTIVIPETVLYMVPSVDEPDTAMDELKYPRNPFASLDSLANIVVDANNPVFEVIDNVLFYKSEEGLSLVCYPKSKTDETGEIATNYVIPEGTVSIGRDAIREAPLSEVTFPSTLTAISMQAFCDCRNLQRVELPESMTELSRTVFYQCIELKEVVLPESLTEIPFASFSYCKELQSVKVSSQLTTIGAKAFRGCESLTDITLPGTVTSIGEEAFEDCPAHP